MQIYSRDTKEAQVLGKILVTMEIHNFKHYMPTKSEVVVIAADHDLLNKASEKALNLGSSELTAKGGQVLIGTARKARGF